MVDNMVLGDWIIVIKDVCGLYIVVVVVMYFFILLGVSYSLGYKLIDILFKVMKVKGC